MVIRIGHLDFDHVQYDRSADVLYLSIGEPREPARQLATPQGHLVMYDDSGDVVAVTLVNAGWIVERDGDVELPFHVAGKQLAPAIS